MSNIVPVYLSNTAVKLLISRAAKCKKIGNFVHSVVQL